MSEIENYDEDDALLQQQAEAERNEPEPDTPPPSEPEPQAAEAPVEAESARAEVDEAVVPIGALHKTRHQNRELKQQIDELRAELEPLKTIKQRIEEAQTRAKEREAAEAFERDPLNALNAKIDGLREQQTQTVEQQRQEREQSEQQQRFVQAVATQVEEFKTQAPDYPDALQHLMEFRQRQLVAMGASQSEAAQTVDQEAMGIAQRALQTGRNPGELVYELAKLSGYNGQANQAPTESVNSDADKKLETIERGQKQRALPASGQADISLTDIASMSDDEFDKHWAEMEKTEKGWH